ncbi:glycosyltransferase family 2 protein [Hymenobacter radiodurans]|uniref:glycosyltransferase family 2 protein n=1 Tax=Hymenobacter radiodurans TaxID=2496028 RepID=UPI00196B809E|nr:glycosyltransferase [Hymenobacter radiodurans]
MKVKMPSADTATPLERIPSVPPTIAAVPAHVHRPMWSVMIPTYNCLQYLQETIESVLAQDPGPELMQIAVVDDCSTDGDVKALVDAVGKNRVEFFQQTSNLGSLRNLESCLNLSTGHRVHLLHGDDKVAPGFYTEIDTLFTKYPEAGAAFTHIAYMTEDAMFINPPFEREEGIVKDFLLKMAITIRVQPPAIVVKRSVYEQLGSFFAVHYGEDWEMWTRIAAHFPVAYSPKCLAHYRYLTSNSITQHSIKTGQNVRDIIKVFNIIQNYLPIDKRSSLRNAALTNYAIYCASLANNLYFTDVEAALVQAKGAFTMSKHRRVLYSLFKFYLKYFMGYNHIKYLWSKFIFPDKTIKLLLFPFIF